MKMPLGKKKDLGHPTKEKRRYNRVDKIVLNWKSEHIGRKRAGNYVIIMTTKVA